MMETYAHWLEAVGAQTVGWLWIPVAVWTVMAGLLHLYIRRSSPGHPLVRYQLLRALYWALPLGLLLAGFVDFPEIWTTGADNRAAVTGGGGSVVEAATGLEAAALPESSPWTILGAVGFLTVAAGAAALGRLLWVGYQMVRLYLFQRQVVRRPSPPDLREKLRRIRRQIGIRSSIRLLVGPEETVPMTFGVWSPVIVLPPSIVNDPERLEMTLVHELAHIRRGDYIQQWLEEVAGIALAGHPLARCIRREIATLREMACDADVLDCLPYGPRSYASLLYEMSVTARGEASAVALSEDENNLKRRIEAMRDYEFDLDDWWNPKRLGLTLGGLLLASAVLVVACSEMTGPNQPATSVEQAGDSETEKVFVAVETMPELIGGIDGLAREVTYPESAREAGIEGKVIVQFVVDEQGNVSEPTVLKAPDGAGAEALEDEALRVVRQAKFKPGSQRGKPVPVKLSLPVTFNLGNDAAENGASSAGPDDASNPAAESTSDRAARSSSESRSVPEIREGPPGRITGTVTTGDGQALPGANIVLSGTTTGATTTSEGEYTILDVSPGTYNVRVSYVGYTTMVVEGVEVQSEMTTTVNAELRSESIGLEEVRATGGN